MRILLVEDDRDVAEYIRRELEDEGHHVSVCHDGSAGLRAAEHTAFDIIVLDIMLPAMDGLQGVGFEYWHNMFGKSAGKVPGANQLTPVFTLAVHLPMGGSGH
jgi:hypothetical protein